MPKSNTSKQAYACLDAIEPPLTFIHRHYIAQVIQKKIKYPSAYNDASKIEIYF